MTDSDDLYPDHLGNHVYIDPSARIGNNNLIYPFVYIGKNVEIGDNNTIYPFTSIGTPGEHKTAEPLKGGKTVIGSNNIIRENVTIQAPIGTLHTIIGNNCYIMNKCHIAHDCIVENEAIMSTGSIIGGYTILEKYVNMGLGAVVHQRLVIGQSAMIGMNSTVTKNILPFTTVIGTPAKIKGFNRNGALKRGFKEKDVDRIGMQFKLLVSGAPVDLDGIVSKAVKSFFKDNDNVLDDFSGNL